VLFVTQKKILRMTERFVTKRRFATFINFLVEHSQSSLKFDKMLALVALCASFVSTTHGSLPALRNSLNGAETNDNIILENGYTKVSFSKSLGHIDSIFADFTGKSKYSTNILSSSFGVEILKSEQCLEKVKPVPQVQWLEKSSTLHKVQISNVFDCGVNPLVSETWTLSLHKNQRSVDVEINGKILRTDDQVQAISHSLHLKTLSLYGLYDRGVVQMMDKEDACMGTEGAVMNRTYFIGTLKL
jgi:hypothetical protein